MDFLFTYNILRMMYNILKRKKNEGKRKERKKIKSNYICFQKKEDLK